jgi:hypothetical protein
MIFPVKQAVSAFLSRLSAVSSRSHETSEPVKSVKFVDDNYRPALYNDPREARRQYFHPAVPAYESERGGQGLCLTPENPDFCLPWH